MNIYTSPLFRSPDKTKTARLSVQRLRLSFLLPISSMSSTMLGSQSLVLATTAMVVSSTVLFLAFSRHKPDPSNQRLRSCLCSDGKKSGQKKKKRVKFAESVKEPRTDGQEFRRKQQRNSTEKSCRECEISSSATVMPANRVALYSGILRDRAQRMERSY